MALCALAPMTRTTEEGSLGFMIRWTVLCVLLMGLGCSSSAAIPAAPGADDKPEPAAAEVAEPKVDSFWRHMLRTETVWVLQPSYTPKGDKPSRLEIELHNRRERDGVVIVDLRWTRVDGNTGKREPFQDDRRIAHMAADGKSALWLRAYDDPRDDAGIVAELREAPTYADDPPRVEHTEKPESSYSVTVEGKAPDRFVCFERGPGKESGDCSNVCFSAICVSESRGIVSMTGTYMGDKEYEAIAK